MKTTLSVLEVHNGVHLCTWHLSDDVIVSTYKFGEKFSGSLYLILS